LAHRIRIRRRGRPGGFVAAAIAVGVVLAAAGSHGPPGHASAVSRVPGKTAAAAIAYARAQLGKPYQWGGTGPDAFDCSGLVMMAYRAAGVGIARTSQDQWATEPHVTKPEPGDLVFFAGSDGTMTSPGHVGIVIGRGDMIEAYATGYPIRVASYDRSDLVGFTQPWGGGA
jgi:cell wall-associated NlpC family hydrolase